MKIILCLLLCLALAQGHIFRRQSYPKEDAPNVQPQQYINQAQWAQPEAQPQVPRVSKSILDYIKKVDIDDYNVYNPAEDAGMKDEKRKQQYPRSQQQNQDLRARSYDLRDTESWGNSVPVNMPRRMYWVQPQFSEQQQNAQSSHDSTSVENSWENPMSNENRMPYYADVKTMRNRAYQSQAEQLPSYGDAISWRGIQFAASPRLSFNSMKENIEKIFNEAYKTMKHFSKERKDNFHQNLKLATEKVNEDSQLNATQLLTKYQYAVETHNVKTDDGYYLTLFRIASKQESFAQRPVVFLMHGLFGSADDWLVMGPNKSLAYMLSDAGFDVWLGNARGNKYSRRHASKHPAQSDFWQYSTDEIALHDLPAMIDYVLKTSEHRQLQYVGYSQGTTAFFALTATRPEYNRKITMMYALSPMVYMSEVRSPMLRMMDPTSPFYERLHEQLGHGEFKPSKEMLYDLGGSMCENEIGCKNVCSNLNFVMSGVNTENLDVERIPVIMAHLPAGGSTRQVKQYAQAVASRDFTRYDYGSKINQEVYGSTRPPRYDMSKVEAPVALYYSDEDWLAHPRDVERLASELPKAQSYNVGSNFSHMDFQFSKNVHQVVYNRLIDSMKQTSEQKSYGY